MIRVVSFEPGKTSATRVRHVRALQEIDFRPEGETLFALDLVAMRFVYVWHRGIAGRPQAVSS